MEEFLSDQMDSEYRQWYQKIVNKKFRAFMEYTVEINDCPDISPYRMNLLAVSHINKYIFVGCGNKIKPYPITDNGFILPRKVGDEEQMLYVKQEQGNIINQLKLAYWRNREILVAVDMTGGITVFNAGNLKQKALRLDNVYQNEADCSTWSLDALLLEDTALLACGSNAKKISIWDMGDIFSREDNQLGGQENIQRRVIEGIHHNVPCVKFSPCGIFLAAVSIDETLRIFTVKNAEEIASLKLDDWGWSVNWILKTNTINFNIDLKDVQYSQVSPPPMIAEQNEILNALQKYLLVSSTTHKFQLIDPVPIIQKDKKVPEDNSTEQKSRTIAMKQVHSLDFNMLQTFRYNRISRYSLVHLNAEMNIIIATPQHTPFIHCFEIIFNVKTQGFLMQKINIDLIGQFEGFIIGSCVNSIPCTSPFEKKVQLFILNIQKKIHLFSINKEISLYLSQLTQIADYSHLSI